MRKEYYMALRMWKAGEKFTGNQWDIIKDNGKDLDVRYYKVDHTGKFVGFADVKVPATDAPFALFISLLGGEAKVRELAMRAHEVNIRAKIGAKRKANANGTARRF